MENKSRKVNSKLRDRTRLKNIQMDLCYFLHLWCILVCIYYMLQEVLNFRLAHNGLFTAVLVCLDLSSYLCVILLYGQMSKNPMFRGCSYNCLSKWCMFFSKIFIYLNAKGKIIYIFMTLSNTLCTCWRNSFAGRRGHKLLVIV